MSPCPTRPTQLTFLSFQAEMPCCICHFSTKNIVSDSHCWRMKSRLQELSLRALLGLPLAVFSPISSVLLLYPALRAVAWPQPQHAYSRMSVSLCFLPRLCLSPALLIQTLPLKTIPTPSVKPGDEFLLASPAAHFT